jgi:hypothetical protein
MAGFSETEAGSVKPARRRAARWALRLGLPLVALAVAYIAILVFPTPLFSHSVTNGTYRVYSNDPLPEDFSQVITELDRRIKGMEHEPPAASQRIYLCGSRMFYFYAFMLGKNPESLAIGLSVANASFVSVERVRLFAELNHGVLRHTRFEGNMAEVVAHEIAHFNSVHALGYRGHLRQPRWKSEGWAEYQANLAAIRADPEYDLVSRIDRLLDAAYWRSPDGFARRMWESQLLVEFLGEVKGYSLKDLVREQVTESLAREQMMSWYREKLSERAAAGS